MELFISALVALAVAFGSPAPTSTAPSEATVQTVQQESTEEQVLRVDAQQTVVDRDVKATASGYNFVPEYLYSTDVAPTRETFGLGEFAYESIDLEGVYHVYRWTIIYSA